MKLEHIGLIIPDKTASDFPRWKRGISFPPLTMEAVAASIDTDADIKIINETVKPLDLDSRFDLVGISINTANAGRGYELARHFREQGAYVVMGGVHVSVLPEEALQYSNSVVVGEAEEAFQRLINDLLDGNPQRIYKNAQPFDLSKLKPPRRDLQAISEDMVAPPVESSRGCCNACSFCYHSPYSERPIGDIVREISELDSDLFRFIDLNIGYNREFALELFKRIKHVGKKWFAEVQSNRLLDEEFLFYASQAGCFGVFAGYESVNQASIREARKGFNKPEEYTRGVGLAHKHGIMVKGSFIFGFDHDTKETFDRCVRLAIDMNLDLAAFNVLTPYPNTPLFGRLQSEGRLLYTNFPHDWAKYERTKAVFQPQHITPEELEEGVSRCWREFYSTDSIEKRFPREYRDSSMQTKFAYNLNLRAHSALEVANKVLG
jgi:radical SAM superfamily enzyme YgiQ (UPF0313 family)